MDPCVVLSSVAEGDRVTLNAAVADPTRGCDVNGADTPGVVVSGSWTGDLRCRRCTGWTFERVAVTAGSLRMIGGRGWSVTDSTFDGGGRGVLAVLGTGSEPSGGTDADPVDWTITRVTVGGAGCLTGEAFNHAHALYVIGRNGVPNKGRVEDSAFSHGGCGATVKLGATGNDGAGTASGDAADDVTLTRNVVANGPGLDSSGVLVAGNSDAVTIGSNDIRAAGPAVAVNGPFSGTALAVVGNTISGTGPFLYGRRFKYPDLAWAGEGVAGVVAQTIVEPGPCPPWGACADNARPTLSPP